MKVIQVRVTDVVLGVAKAWPTTDNTDRIEFTLQFPAGARINYVGERTDPDGSDGVALSGTWRQIPSGVFGADSGHWEVSTPSEE